MAAAELGRVAVPETGMASAEARQVARGVARRVGERGEVWWAVALAVVPRAWATVAAVMAVAKAKAQEAAAELAVGQTAVAAKAPARAVG